MKIKLKGALAFDAFDSTTGRTKKNEPVRHGRMPRSVIDKKKLKQVVENMKGGATLRSQSIACGFKGDNELRAALRSLLGQEGYKSILTAKRVTVSPRDRVRVSDAKVPVLDGKKLKWRKSDAIMIYAAKRCREIQKQARDVVAQTPFGKALAREYLDMRAIVKQKTVGRWHCRQVASHAPEIHKIKIDDGLYEVRDNGLITLYVSPKGREYVKASPMESADLILKYPDFRVRLARWQQSAKGKKATKAIARHEKALQHHRRKHAP